MEMRAIAICVTRPLYLYVFFFLLAVWPFLGWIARRRGADLRIFSIFPLILGTTAASMGTIHVADRLSLDGRSPHAAAAGLAEALTPLIAGAILSACIAGVIAAFPPFREARRHRGIAATAIAVLFLIGAALYLLVVIRIRTGAFFAPELLRFSVVAFGLNAAALLCAAVFAFVRQQRLTSGSGRASFLALATAGVLVAGVLAELVHRLALLAVSGF
jgi:hypothetical protein